MLTAEVGEDILTGVLLLRSLPRACSCLGASRADFHEWILKAMPDRLLMESHPWLGTWHQLGLLLLWHAERTWAAARWLLEWRLGKKRTSPFYFPRPKPARSRRGGQTRHGVAPFQFRPFTAAKAPMPG